MTGDDRSVPAEIARRPRPHARKSISDLPIFLFSRSTGMIEDWT